MRHLHKIPCSKDRLSEIRQFVRTYLAEFKITNVRSHEIVLAIDEVCANLIIHSNNCNPCYEIEVAIELKSENTLYFEIMDQGIAFDLSQYKEPSLRELIDNKKKGGLGLLLVKRIMDSVEFKCEKGRNVCRMIKRI